VPPRRGLEARAIKLRASWQAQRAAWNGEDSGRVSPPAGQARVQPLAAWASSTRFACTPRWSGLG